MSTKRFFLQTLAVGVVLTLALGLIGDKRVAARPVSGGASQSASLDEIDAYLEQQMARLNIPGAALAVVEDDKIVHMRGFGRARPGGESPSPQTPFVIGSITKSFTALAVMQLVEAKKIDLDAPVQRYLPWFRVADPQASAQMTVRHLLNQTSSLPTLRGWQVLADFDDRPDAAERQARALGTLALTRPVGTAFEYSNLNYNLLGLIVEAASGEPYASYVEDHIFTPLEMTHSYTTQAEAKQNGLAVGHQYWFWQPFAVPDLPIPRGSLPAGELISSAEDVAHYLIAHLNDGRYGNVQVLSGAGIDELHRGEPAVTAMGTDIGKYGMGWFDGSIGQTKIVWHTGSQPDFSSYAGLLPEQKKGVVILLNVDHFLMEPVLTEVGNGMAALLAGAPPAQNQFGYFPWLMRGLLVVPILQVVGVVATLRLVRRWRRDPGHRPSRARMWGLHILLPLIPNLSLAAVPVLLQSSGMFRFALLFAPDFSWLGLICGGFAGVWTILRTALILRTLRGPSPQTLGGPLSVNPDGLRTGSG